MNAWQARPAAGRVVVAFAAIITMIVVGLMSLIAMPAPAAWGRPGGPELGPSASGSSRAGLGWWMAAGPDRFGVQASEG